LEVKLALLGKEKGKWAFWGRRQK